MKRFRVQEALGSFDMISIAMLSQEQKVSTNATEVIYTPHVPGSIIQPFLSLTREEAQELVNELYSVGIQPSQLRGSTGQLAAVHYHLEDMRKLVFK